MGFSRSILFLAILSFCFPTFAEYPQPSGQGGFPPPSPNYGGQSYSGQGFGGGAPGAPQPGYENAGPGFGTPGAVPGNGTPGFGQAPVNPNPNYGGRPGYTGAGTYPPSQAMGRNRTMPRAPYSNNAAGYRNGYANRPENYSPNISGPSGGNENLTVPYEAPAPQIVEESRVAASHAMRHSFQILSTCNGIRANHYRVSDELLGELVSQSQPVPQNQPNQRSQDTERGYAAMLVNELLLGANSPSAVDANNSSSTTSQQFPEVGYAVCWWADEMRLRATKVLEGIRLTQMISPTEQAALYKQNVSVLFQQARALNIASHAAIATGYFYVAALHRTCISESPEDTTESRKGARSYYCPGPTEQIVYELVSLESKLKVMRDLMDNVRRYANLKPGFPANSCVECTFRQFRYDPSSKRRQNYVPYPFYPYPEAQSGSQPERNPYLIYESKRPVTAKGITQKQDDGVVSFYDGSGWQEAWNLFDLGYLNPKSPNATRAGGPPPAVGNTGIPKPVPGVNGLPATDSLRVPMDTLRSNAIAPPPGNTGGTGPEFPDDRAGSEAPPSDEGVSNFGDADPTIPRVAP